MVWNQIEHLFTFGIDFVIEGWGSRQLRDQVRKEINRIGIDSVFLFIDCPREIRHERVKDRNKKLNG